MIDRRTLGLRVRDARATLGLTLKEVEQASGFSATHISEIERGRTSPTIGALIAIARALGHDPISFVSERKLEPAVVASVVADPVPASGGRLTALTPGVVGGHLLPEHLTLGPGESHRLAGEGELCGYVTAGEVEIEVGEETARLEPGDAFHHRPSVPPMVRNPGRGVAELVIIRNRRDRD